MSFKKSWRRFPYPLAVKYVLTAIDGLCRWWSLYLRGRSPIWVTRTLHHGCRSHHVRDRRNSFGQRSTPQY